MAVVDPSPGDAAGASGAPVAVRRPRGRTPLAWRNVTHKKAAMVISAVAVAFAVLIMFMELGFLNGLYDSQTDMMDHMRADLVMIASTQHTLVASETFPRSRLEEAAAFPGVRGVYPVFDENGASLLRNPATGVENGIRLIGFNLSDPVFDLPDIERQLDRLRVRRTILYDTASRHFIGRIREGIEVELARSRVVVAGTFNLGADYYHDGTAIASQETFFTLFPGRDMNRAALGLIQLKAGADRGQVLAALRQAFHGDVEVLSKDEVIRREKEVWRKATPAGFVFMLGVAVGFVIGVIITYQILYTDINDRLPQLATMKALGYQNRDVVSLVIKQGLLLGMLGFMPAVGMTTALYLGLTAITGVQTRLTLARVSLVLSLTVLMCVVSSLLASRRALAADPAELF